MSRSAMVPVISRMRSESVDFPWSIWAMMEKFLICEGSVMTIDGSLSLAVFVFNVYVCT